MTRPEDFVVVVQHGGGLAVHGPFDFDTAQVQRHRWGRHRASVVAITDKRLAATFSAQDLRERANRWC